MLTSAQAEKLRKMMIFDEGYRLQIYKDHLGNDTLGIGHLCANGFSDAVVQLIFDEDWHACEVWLLKTFDWYDKLHPVRQLALINMRFQLGSNRFLKFKATIACLANKDYPGASRQILSSLWAKQTQNRNARIAYMVLHGQFAPEYAL